MNNKFWWLAGTALCSLFCLPLSSYAAGMVPETSVVIIEASDGEATMNVKNTDNFPMLLTTTIQGIAQDKEKLLLVSPPAIRVDGGKSQKVRFMLTSKTPLKTERLRRVVFNGIPPQSKGKNEVRISISQNLPVLIRPAGLEPDNAPWKRLAWKVSGDRLQVSNDSPYVVRLAQEVVTLPGNTVLMLPHSYILPGERLTLPAPAGKSLSGMNQVRISPATTWGYAVKDFTAPITR